MPPTRSNTRPPVRPRLAAKARRELRHVLPDAIEQALCDYAGFAHLEDDESAPSEARVFSQYHAACKAALQHLEALLKLAKWVNEDDKPLAQVDGDDQADLRRMMAEAREALAELTPSHAE